MTATNRLPPNSVDIVGCADCPLRHAVEGFDGDEESKCVHPDVPARAVAHDAEEPPDFCPLLHAPLVLRIATPEGA